MGGTGKFGTGCNPYSVPVKTSCPLGRKSAALPVGVVTLANRGEETGANIVISLPDVPQEFPLMVGCAACAGRWVLLGLLLFLVSDALGCLGTCYFGALKIVNSKNPELKSHSKSTVICGDQHWHSCSSIY